MSVTPVDSSSVPAQAPEASFDDAVLNAQKDEMLLKGVVTLAQTVLMPRMNEILSEAQSDE